MKEVEEECRSSRVAFQMDRGEVTVITRRYEGLRRSKHIPEDKVYEHVESVATRSRARRILKVASVIYSNGQKHIGSIWNEIISHPKTTVL